MKLLRPIFFALLATLVSSNTFAKGGFVMWSWGGESFMKVADLPDTYGFQYNQDYIDIGVKYTEYEIFLLPIWQSDISYIGYIPNDENHYYDLTEEEVFSLARAANISIPPVSQIKLDFWTLWGGKIVLALLILLYAAYSMWPAQREQQSEGAA